MFSLETFTPKCTRDLQSGLHLPLADAQSELSLRWAHMSYCWFCHEEAQIPDNCVYKMCANNLITIPYVINDNSRAGRTNRGTLQ